MNKFLTEMAKAGLHAAHGWAESALGYGTTGGSGEGTVAQFVNAAKMCGCRLESVSAHKACISSLFRGNAYVVTCCDIGGGAAEVRAHGQIKFPLGIVPDVVVGVLRGLNEQDPGFTHGLCDTDRATWWYCESQNRSGDWSRNGFIRFMAELIGRVASLDATFRRNGYA
jgi:hypothetical protein